LACRDGFRRTSDHRRNVVRLARQTGANRFISGLAALLCLVALAITMWEFVSVPSTVDQAVAIAAIVVGSIAIEWVYQLSDPELAQLKAAK
jgi:hypothetical protein